ncbi:2-amino-4-hydroxy-6-hydroxymethyldihydropteridine diphosphokinase [Oceanicoccus sp. KOV_DT_Chl]|uniref:2-amino-4-hydroxy-6- hydroxymethyldihydropteridine diphosphokinase n=1 Tax=Oceanicoccus sp. KOV_DT_Chl TaxID=1904639 RepID=UPI000C7DA8C2|nr:2-amino-4-hydroxy-6-hydroxymethyldihydropteridine diphosphokinase [Oceanicoccus sp. KOV_DT_Chl]
MAQVFVGVGSSIDRYRHITASLEALEQHFGVLRLSPVYESEAVGFVGENFLNLVVSFYSQLSVAELSTLLRQIEYDNGHRRGGTKFSPRSLDIDILCVDDLVGTIDGIELPRGEITENAFVLRPLFDIAPQQVHPLTAKTYTDLWRAYDQCSQKLWRVDFEWRGKNISSAN